MRDSVVSTLHCMPRSHIQEGPNLDLHREAHPPLQPTRHLSTSNSIFPPHPLRFKGHRIGSVPCFPEQAKSQEPKERPNDTDPKVSMSSSLRCLMLLTQVQTVVFNLRRPCEDPPQQHSIRLLLFPPSHRLPSPPAPPTTPNRSKHLRVRVHFLYSIPQIQRREIRFLSK